MFKYLLLVQVLLAKELYSWEHPSVEEHLQRSLETSASKSEPVPYPFTYGNFPQKLNHFDPNDSRRWLQQYSIREDFYQPSGPIFLILKSSPLLMNAAWLEYAKQFGALCVTLERRYYGLSRATNDLSTENLKYLNSQQELADIANFVSNKNGWLRKDTHKLVIFGAAYEGSIAAWFRLKYPHLVDGAVTSSARLDSVVAFTDYYRLAAEALGNHSKKCADGVRDAFKELNTQLEHQDGQEQIKQLFELCPTRNEEISPDDISNLNKVLAETISRFAFHSNAFICTTITNQTIGTPLDRLAWFVRNIFLRDCLSYKYVDMIKFWYSNTDLLNFSNLRGVRQDLYQECTELGNFPIDPSHVFGDRVSYPYYNKLCTDVFGSDYNLAALTTTINKRKLDYGGKNIDVTNVVFVQGAKDPWLSLGIVKDVNSKAPAIVIEGEYQFADLMFPTENDSAELKEARKKIASNIESWIKE